MESLAARASSDIALAKITAPQRPILSVDRDGAMRSLIEHLSRKIVAIEAPRGSAKSGFMAEAHRRLGEDSQHWRTAWLTIDDADDGERLCRHVLASLQTFWPDLDATNLVLLYRDRPRLCIIELSNFLFKCVAESDVEYILFVDDLHLASSEAIDEFLDAVARYFPQGFHLVISGSRVLWGHIDLGLCDQISVFPQRKLNFTQDEVEGILSQAMSFHLSSDTPFMFDFEPFEVDEGSTKLLAADLRRITEGWPLGVRMYADALARGSVDFAVSADERALLKLLGRFFRNTVLDSLTDDLQQFLIDIALPDKICVGLCNVLTSRSDAKFAIRDLRSKGCYLTPCEGEAGWFEFHPLLKKWLRMKQGQIPLGRVHELCQVMSAWFEEHGRPAEAAKYMLMASDSDFIEGLASAVGYEADRGDRTYFEWMSDVPADDFTEKPHLALRAAWGYIICGRPQDGWHWVDAFERAVLRNADEDALDTSMVAGLVRAKCLEMDCHYDEAIEAGEDLVSTCMEGMSLSQRCLLLHMLAESYARRGRFDDALRNYMLAEAMAELGKADFYMALCRKGTISLRIAQGRLKDALELCQKALDECSESTLPYASLMATKGYLCAEVGRLDEACECVNHARRLVSLSRNMDMSYEVEVECAHCLVAMGQGAQAFRVATKTSLQIGGSNVPRSINLLVYLRNAWVALSMRYLSEARASAERLRAMTGEGDVAYELAYQAVSAAIDDANGLAGKAADILPFVERAHDAGLELYELELSLSAAERFVSEGLHSNAILYVDRALRIQTDQQIVGPFLRAGRNTRALLHEIVDVRKSGGQVRQLAKKVLRRFDSGEAVKDASGQASCPATRFGLTEREIEVLNLLDAGMSRREIADTLVITINTVKSHMNRIYSKLGVSNRIDAFSIMHSGDNK